jgi:glucokinase
MHWLGIDLGGTNTKVVVIDDQGSVIARTTFASRGEAGPAEFMRRAASELGSLLEANGSVAGVGFSIAALVDDRQIPVAAPNLPAFVGVDLHPLLQPVLGKLPLTVENDVNAAVVGEHLLGAGRGLRDFCMLSLGTGVGGGLILDDRLYHGAGGLAGELGHILLDLEGPVCACGQRGHLESYLSTAAIVARAESMLGQAEPGDRAALEASARENGGELTPRGITECARNGDALSREVLAESGRILGAACASLVHVLHPARVIVGGGVSAAGDLLLDAARSELRLRGMSASARSVPIVQAELGVEGAAIGAAMLVRRTLDA